MFGQVNLSLQGPVGSKSLMSGGFWDPGLTYCDTDISSRLYNGAENMVFVSTLISIRFQVLKMVRTRILAQRTRLSTVCLYIGYNHSGKLGQIDFLYGVMGMANAQRTMNYIRIITEFISQDEWKNVVITFGIVNEALIATIGTQELRGL
jgi:hypothetical protein